MAIQGIIRGFANPENHNQNVILVGRGDVYVLIVDGKPSPTTHADIDSGINALAGAMGSDRDDWQCVSGLRTDAVNGNSAVTSIDKTWCYNGF